MGFFDRLQKGLAKTKSGFIDKLAGVFSFSRIDDDFYDELEEILIQADVGVETSLYLTECLRARVKEEKISDAALLAPILQEEIASVISATAGGLRLEHGLNILIMVGVNGVGKTTTIGKLASRYNAEGKRVVLAAADTFRAAAGEQLMAWANRSGVELIGQGTGADPGAVVFDACHAATARKAEILIIDTAGRLQNKANLMEELKKIIRIAEREAPDAHMEILLVLDAGTGQNAISQAKLFGEAAPLSGIILTKLDGTAKGGVVIGICRETGVPIKLIGVGEGIDDLQDFNPDEFAKALFN